ncbi:MAG: glutamyl-tRNA(Gln) amidotransferase subunit [Archaeoglobaceae archaeon]|nr:glutamyl-tRNA(Gln) amidotransferase subunit [Archaeoglobaceae archaeon]
MIGKRVRIKAKGKIFEGIVMPSFTGNLVLKLDNGYNAGFKDYELIEVLEEVRIQGQKPEIARHEDLPNVKIISTGGTIASRVDYRTGAVTSQFTAEEIVSDVRRVYEALKEYDGVIITHGTDTMHYTASALAFMLSTPKPVVFVGAQRSSDDFCYAHRAVKVRKMHTSRRDAFQSINAKPVARIDYPSLNIEWISWRYRRGERELKLLDKLEEKVVLIKFFPGLNADVLEYFHSKGYRGFVIEGTGLGHVSTDWINTLKRICEDSVVVMTSQCLHGRICDRVYDTGRDLLKAGVIEGEDMLPEVALTKLMFLLGNYDFEEAKKLVKKNLVGEIEPRSTY